MMRRRRRNRQAEALALLLDLDGRGLVFLFVIGGDVGVALERAGLATIAAGPHGRAIVTLTDEGRARAREVHR